MQVRLYVKVGYPVADLKHLDYDWPAALPFPIAGDFLTVGEQEFEVDHREFVPDALGPRPLVGISLAWIHERVKLEGWT
jgi:hypothetical protein